MASEVSEMLDTARETLAEALEALRAGQARVIAKLKTLDEAEEYDDKLGSHLAWVASKVAEITSSLRQLEKHDKVMAKTPQQRFDLICAYLRAEATPEQCAAFSGILRERAEGSRVLS